ncbi:MAG: NAD-dependent epimerase/dehydratase family protein [Hyphomicrobiales bacterium]|nr:NAD-dependent epimerase/dehydratase family protein [Hyphomicrobiales bacterium]
MSSHDAGAPIDLVTGGSGFIGSHLVAALVGRGGRVRVLDLIAPEIPTAEVEFIPGSILDDSALARAMAGVRRVYHLAGIAQLWTRDRADFNRINTAGTTAVVRAALSAGVERIVHCSTEAILLPQRGRGAATLVDESVQATMADMPGPYTRSKLAAEQGVLDAARAGADAVVVNPTVPIGPGDRNRTPPAAMLAMFINGGTPAYLDCVLNLVDVRDVAAGMVLAGQHGRRGERYILGGENVALGDLLQRLERVAGRSMPKRRVPGWLALASAAVAERIADWTGRPPAATREGVRLALRSQPFDSRKARDELGYVPRPLDAALADAVAWLMRRNSNAEG